MLEDAPGRLVSDAEFTFQLLCRDTAAGRSHQKHCVEPKPERSAGMLHNGTGHRRNMMPTIVTGIDWPTCRFVVLSKGIISDFSHQL